MKLKINGTLYDGGAIADLTLLDLLQLEQQTDAAGRKFTRADFEQLVGEMEALPQEDWEAHPDILWLVGITVWVARRKAGERLTFEEAVDFPLRKFFVVAELGDEVVSPGNRQARRAATRKGSGRAAGRPAAKAQAPRKPSSSKASGGL